MYVLLFGWDFFGGRGREVGFGLFLVGVGVFLLLIFLGFGGWDFGFFGLGLGVWFFFPENHKEYLQNVFPALGELRDRRSFYSFPPMFFDSLPYSSQPCSSMLITHARA